LIRNFTFVIKSLIGGPSSNQMDEANTNRDDASPSAVNVLYSQIEDE